jgi:hypothetical protein
VVIIGLTSTFLLVSQGWRQSLIALALQYLAAFWLVGLVWPINLAVVKLVVGWMVIATIGTTQPGNDYIEDKFSGFPGLLIRLLSASLIGLLVFSVAPSLARILPSGRIILWGGLILIGMGLLQLGMSTRVSRIFLGLFTMLSGFEILYASVESSLLVAGLLAVINLGLAMIGSYLMIAPKMEAAS